MPPREVQRIDRGLIHRSAWKVLSPRFISTILYSAGLSEHGSDTSSGPTLLVVGTSGSPLRDGRSQPWRMVKDEGRQSLVKVLENPSIRRDSVGS
jgi:hypothetical protein